MGRSKSTVKSFEISKRLVFEAWEKVRVNDGAPGVDAVSVAQFGSDERNNPYKLWNRMSAGSYFPAPVRAVEIPKDHGLGVRVLGVPNVVDRIAQTGAMQKFKRLRGKPAKARAWLDAVRQHQPRLFAHWHLVAPTPG